MLAKLTLLVLFLLATIEGFIPHKDLRDSVFKVNYFFFFADMVFKENYLYIHMCVYLHMMS